MCLQQISTKTNEILRRPWMMGLLLALCFVPWFATRMGYIYLYQVPPNQTIHPNYYTFHEMATSWVEGKKLGVIDLNRMLANSHHSATSDYITAKAPTDQYCTYLALDPGFALMVAAARYIPGFHLLPDSYLRVECFQVICDGLMLFAIFLTFWRMGPVAATAAGLFYGLSPVFAYNAIYPFQYFWEGWLVCSALLSLIWARRSLLAQRRISGIILIALVAIFAGFALWVRSTSLIAVIALIATFVTVPSLRRYCGVFFLVLALTIAPQVIRASSVAGHFALSTRMSWHTAYQGLGRYPNKYGLEDDDLYVFTHAQNVYGVAFNYCNYMAEDNAMHDAYFQLGRQDPAFVMRGIVDRIFGNVIFNYDFDHRGYTSLALFVAAFMGLICTLWRRGEYLFTAGVAAMIYAGYCVAVGLVYYMSPPYADVAQLALLFMIPGLVSGVGELVSSGGQKLTPLPPRARVALIALVMGGIALTSIAFIPVTRAYLFPPIPYQHTWVSFGFPNGGDTEKLIETWKNLPPRTKEAFLDLARKSSPSMKNPQDAIGYYIVNYFKTSVYFDRPDGDKQKAIFTLARYAGDLSAVMKAVSESILGWRALSIEAIDLTDPDSWDGRKIHIKLVPTPERAGVDYQRLADEKFHRFNYDVTWLGPDELIARHNGHGCDALRTVMATFFHGYCPYDPTTGPSPLAPSGSPKIPAAMPDESSTILGKP